MTLQLSVQITADASGLKREAAEARAATEGLGSALDAVGGKASGAAGRLDAAAAAAGRLDASGQSASGAAAGSRPGQPDPASPRPAPAPPAPAPPRADNDPRPQGPRGDFFKQLGFQANDAATSLASGAPITQVIGQQAGQVLQTLGDHPDGVAGGLKLVAERALSILTPVRLLVAGFAGLGGTIAYLGYQWDQSQSRIKQGLTGIGAMSRATVGDINRIAEAAASGNLLSSGEARGVATAIAATGRVDVANIGAVTNLAPGYANLFDKDLEEAGGDLARIFADPIKGAEDLNARIGGLDGRTQAYIRTLTEQGDRQRAVLELVQTFGPELERAAEKTSNWTRAWNYLGSVAASAGEMVAKPFQSGPLARQLADAEAELTSVRQQPYSGEGASPAAAIPELEARIARLKAEIEAERRAPGEKLSKDLSTAGEKAVRTAMPDIMQREQAETQIALLGKLQADPQAMAGLSVEARGRVTASLQAYISLVDTTMPAEERARASEALTIREIEARTVAERAAIAAQRERLSLTGQKVDGGEAERERREAAAAAAVVAQSTREAEDRLRSSRDAADLTGLSPYRRERAEMEARYRDILDRDQGNPSAIGRNEAARAIEGNALGARQAEAAARGLLPEIAQTEALRDQVEALQRADRDAAVAAGMSAEARARNKAALEAATGALDTYLSTQDKARASEALTIRSIEARTAAQKAAVEAERERLALAGQAITAEDRQQRIEAARRASFAQNTREAQDRLRSAEDAAAGAGLTGLPRRRAELGTRERRALEAAEGNLPAYAATQKAFGLERRGLEIEALSSPLRDADRAIREQTAALGIQQAAFGVSTEAAERMAAAQQLINRYTAEGVPVTDNLRRIIDSYADTIGKLAAQQEDLTRRQRAAVGSMDDMRYGLRGGITGALGDVINGRNPLDSLAKTGERTALSLIERTTIEPMISSLLGSEGKPGGGLLGDTLGGIFGKAAGLSNADITAGVVNVTGPVSGLGGLTGLGGTAASGNTPGGSVPSLIGTGLPGLGDKASTFTGGQTAGDLDRYASAIRKIESGSAAGNYGAIGPLTKTGDRAYGAYQVMGNNIPSWTDKALGRTLTPEQFLSDRAAQDAVFRDQFSGSVKRFGNPQDAASVWFTGRPLSQGAGSRDVLGTTGSGYVDRFNRALPALPPAADAPAVTAPGPSAVTAPLSGLDASLGTINSSATKAAEGVASLSGDLSALPGPLSQTAQGLNQVSSSLGSGGSGGGLLGMIAQLFSGGGGASAAAGAGATVAAATGGLITGPGTGTSDSILARVSNGEFVVRAEAARDKLPLLQAINENRLPVFAAGGIVGQAPPAARPQVRERAAEAASAQAGGGGVNVQVHNYAGVEVEQTAKRRPDGGQDIRVELRRMVADELARPGSDAGRALESNWGLSRTLARRG